MARSARQLLGADVGVGVTPPAQEADDVDEGTVYVAFVSDDGERVVSSRFAQARPLAMQRAAVFGLVELARSLVAGEV